MSDSTHAPSAPPAPPATTDPNRPAVPIRAQWTPAKQRIFIAALLETGSVARAARAAGMSRSSAHRLRLRLAGTPFDHHWDHALAHHARRLADPFGTEAQASASAARVGGPTAAPVPRP